MGTAGPPPRASERAICRFDFDVSPPAAAVVRRRVCMKASELGLEPRFPNQTTASSK